MIGREKFLRVTEDYYKHQQKFFLETYMTRAWFIGKKTMLTGTQLMRLYLANEQVINGRGWRSGCGPVERKKLKSMVL